MPKTENENDDKGQTTKGNKTSRRKEEGNEPTVDQIREIVDMTSSVSKKNGELDKENNNFRMKNDDLERKNQSLSQKLADSESRSSSQATRLRDVENKNSSLSKRNEELKKENKELRQKHDDMDKSVEDMTKQLKTTNNQIKDKQADSIRLQDEINEATGKKKPGPKPKRSEEDEKQIKDLEDELATLKRENDQIQKAASQARRDLQQQKWNYTLHTCDILKINFLKHCIESFSQTGYSNIQIPHVAMVYYYISWSFSLDDVVP